MLAVRPHRCQLRDQSLQVERCTTGIGSCRPEPLRVFQLSCPCDRAVQQTCVWHVTSYPTHHLLSTTACCWMVVGSFDLRQQRVISGWTGRPRAPTQQHVSLTGVSIAIWPCLEMGSEALTLWLLLQGVAAQSHRMLPWTEQAVRGVQPTQPPSRPSTSRPACLEIPGPQGSAESAR